MKDNESGSFYVTPTENTPPEIAIYLDIKNELCRSNNVPDFIWIHLPQHLAAWVRTKNQYYLDIAVVLCQEHKFDFPEVLKAELVMAAYMRLNGESVGTLTQVEKASLDNIAFNWVSYFKAAGLTLEDSCQKAAAHIQNNWPAAKVKKASSIEKEYPKKLSQLSRNRLNIGKITREDDIRKLYEKDPSLLKQVLELSNSITCPDDLKGERR